MEWTHSLRRCTAASVLLIISIQLTACGSDNRDRDLSGYSVGGSVSGLTGEGLVLSNNNAETLAIEGNGNFVFATRLSRGSAYSVTIVTQPSGQACSVNNGNGTVSGSNISNIEISCPIQATTLGVAPGNTKLLRFSWNDGFGASLAISHDGTTLVVGAPNENSGSSENREDTSTPYSGAVYLY